MPVAAEPVPLGGGGRFAVESYLDHAAGKLVGRFDANSYLVLTEAMNSHDVGRDRGGLGAALGRVTATAVRAGCALPLFDNSAMDGFAVRAADLADLAQVEAVCEGVDGILHFGGYSVEGSWDAILQANIIMR